MEGPSTLILTRSDVAGLLSLSECIVAVEDAFRLQAEGRIPGPEILGYQVPQGGFHVKAAGLGTERPYFAAKVNANFPENPTRHNLPTIQGVIALYDSEKGVPLALMDSIEITIQRTGAATGVAAKYLARNDAAVATICGCGVQGRVQLESVHRVRPLRKAFAFDQDAERRAAFAAEMSSRLGIEIGPAVELSDATRQSSIVVTCTPSKRVILHRGDVAAGTFVAAVGADNPEKQELDPALMASGTVVVDHLEQCLTIGDLHHAVRAGAMGPEDVYAELGEVVAGQKTGRRSDDEIIIFDSTGTALQDVAAAVVVYEKAVRDGRGIRIALGS